MIRVSVGLVWRLSSWSLAGLVGVWPRQIPGMVPEAKPARQDLLGKDQRGSKAAEEEYDPIKDMARKNNLKLTNYDLTRAVPLQKAI